VSIDGGVLVSDQDEVEAARVARARAVGMFRYQLIRDAADPALTSRQRGRMVRALAAAEHTDPSGQQVRYSRDHLDRWIRAWRRGGFDALVPAGRAPHARTDQGVLELAAALKRERPGRTTAQITRILRTRTGWSPSETTLLRHFHRLGLQIRIDDGADGGGVTVFGRFEADRVNELWTGDALHGPRVGDRKTYLFAFIDDHSRMIVGSRWGFAEDTIRLAAALRPALAARGVPEAVYVDNGSAFVDAWLLRACAHLGIRLTHSTPGRPQGRGKIERFFKTVNDQFLVEIGPCAAGDGPLAGMDPAVGLLELNRLFTAWVEQVYHRRIHSETGQAPLARWDAAWTTAPPPRPTPAALAEAFRWEARRRVTKTATVSLHGNTYLVEAALTGRAVELVFDPFDLTRIEVRHGGRPAGLAVPHVVTRHSHPKARPELPAEPPPATGIDYLRLVADAHQQQIAATVNYAALINAEDSADDPVDGPGPHPDQLDILDLLAATPDAHDNAPREGRAAQL
jgi:putative transposase